MTVLGVLAVAVGVIACSLLSKENTHQDGAFAFGTDPSVGEDGTLSGYTDSG